MHYAFPTMRFNAHYCTGVHWLGNRRSNFVQEDQLIAIQLRNRDWVGQLSIKSLFCTLSLKFSIKFSDASFKYVFLQFFDKRFIFSRCDFYKFETAESSLPMNNIKYFSPEALEAAIGMSLTSRYYYLLLQDDTIRRILKRNQTNDIVSRKSQRCILNDWN